MAQPQKNENETRQYSYKPIERDCPRCDAILVLNEKEECYECPNCGYIDCGNDK